MTNTLTRPDFKIYGTPACVQCNSLDRLVRSRGVEPDYVDLTTDPAAEAHVREVSGNDLRLPYAEVTFPNGDFLAFHGNRRDLIDKHFPAS